MLSPPSDPALVEHWPVRRLRSERLIALGRLVLALSSIVATWLDPAATTRAPMLMSELLVPYLLYSGAIAALVWRSELAFNRWRFATHAVDLVVFTLLAYVSDGPTSPFISYFVFALVCASVRWQWPGTLWTAGVVLILFVCVGVYFREVVRADDFPLQQFIIRGVYLAVIALLLGQLGAHEQQTLREMSLLAAWPDHDPVRADDHLWSTAGYAARIVGAPRLLIVWTVRNEPWTQIGEWTGSQFRVEREPTAGISPCVTESLTARSFFTSDLGSGDVKVRRGLFQRTTVWHGVAVHATLADRFAMRSVLSFPLIGDTGTGRLFFLDKSNPGVDDLLTAEIVASIVTARLDRMQLTAELEQAAAAQERIRLARDLHDGVLQAFTSVSFRLAAASQLLRSGSAGAAEAIEQAHDTLRLEQRDIRVFVDELRPAVATHAHPRLDSRLAELAERMAEEWNLDVDLDVSQAINRVPPRLGRELYLIVREALANSVRHGRASMVRIRLIDMPGCGIVRVSVSDNGCGFPFKGTIEADAPLLAQYGPRSLRDRVTALGGSLRIDSSSAGASLDIIVPIPIA